MKIENFRSNSSAVLLSISSKKKKVSNSFSGCATLFYKISRTVKLVSLELDGFDLAGQYSQRENTGSIDYLELYKEKR